MADNGVEPCTSTTATRQTFPMPTPHVANLVLVASSYVSAQLPTGEIGLHQLHWTCCVTEPIPLHTKTNPVEQQFPVHLQLNESKVRLSCSGGFEYKRSESSQDMMRRMNNWLAQIRTRTQLKHPSLHSCEDYGQLSATLPVYLGSPFMSYQLPNGNRLSPQQLDPIFCVSLGRNLGHGNERHGIDPNMSNSGHHDCSTKTVFLCIAVNCNVATCWQVKLIISQHTQPCPPFFHCEN